jgi:hypothetical protein
MSDELTEMFIQLAVQFAAPVLNAQGGDIQEVIWRHGCLRLADMMRERGIPEEKIAEQLSAARATLFGEYEEVDEFAPTLPLPPKLMAELREDFDARQSGIGTGEPELLLEFVVKGIADFRIDLYPNESQHRGRPHCRVHLQDGPINVSLERPPIVLAGRRNMRGEAAALKCVEANLSKILQAWADTRPDTQKL